MSKELLSYNERGALANVLALEEHLAQLPPGIPNSWCSEKHALIACDHHLTEAVNHASRIDPRLADRYRKVKALAEQVLKPSLPGVRPDLGEVAGLRNTMRAAFGDPTLEDKSCSVCSKDKAMHPLHPRHPFNGQHSMHGLGAANDVPFYKNPLMILAGVGVLFFLLRPKG